VTYSGRDPAFWIRATVLVASIMATLAALRDLAGGHRLGIDLQARPCLPWRVYWIEPLGGAVARGELVSFRSERMRPATSNEAVKWVRGMPGDHVRVADARLFLNGIPVAILSVCRSSWRADYCADREYRLRDGEYLLLGNDAFSFDSRYWGPVRRGELLGRVRPVV